jgi:hypothetical protein
MTLAAISISTGRKIQGSLKLERQDKLEVLWRELDLPLSASVEPLLVWRKHGNWPWKICKIPTLANNWQLSR